MGRFVFPLWGQLRLYALSLRYCPLVAGELMGRFVFPLWGPLDRWWLPSYLRLKMELALTPIKVGVTCVKE